MSGWNLSKLQGGEEARQTNNHGKSIPSRGKSYSKDPNSEWPGMFALLRNSEPENSSRG